MEYTYETHMHTAEVSACATATAAEQVRKYKQLGYTGIIITDHFVNGNSVCSKTAPWADRMQQFVTGYNNAKKEGDKCGLDVYFGWEYSVNGLDFLTYGLDYKFLAAHPDVDKLAIEDYSALIRQCGGYIAQAHPYRKAWYLLNDSAPVEWQLLDGIEVFNPGDVSGLNDKAFAFARRHGLPVQAGSDSHGTDHRRYTGIIMQEKANDIFDIIDAIKEKKVKLI